jgi:hypothetical protein
MKKRIISMLMCLVIVFTLVSTTVNEKANANPALAYGVVEVIEWLMAVCGITFATAAAQYAAANSAYSIPKIKVFADSASLSINTTGTTPNLLIPKSLMQPMYDAITAMKAFFSRLKSNITATTPDTAAGVQYNGIRVTPLSSDAAEMYANSLYTSADTVTVSGQDGISHTYSLTAYSSGASYGYEVMRDGKLATYTTSPTSYLQAYAAYGTSTSYYVSNTYKWGFTTYTDSTTGNVYLNPYVVNYCVYTANGKASGINGNKANSLFTWQWFCPTASLLVQGTEIAIPDKQIAVTYNYAITYDDAELIAAIKKAAAELAADGAFSIPLDEPATDVVNGKEETDNPDSDVSVPLSTWATAWAALGITDLIKTLSQNTAANESDFNAPTIATDLSGKFPFCVPFDIGYIVTSLNATAEAPVWTVPFKIESLGFNYNFTFDMSQFESVAVIIRWGNLILFILALVLITRSIIQG